jgi:hypothetical protein
LGGSLGIAGGAVAFTFAGFPAVMALITLAALLGAGLCLTLTARP